MQASIKLFSLHGYHATPTSGKFRPSAKRITITNTSSRCGYVRRNRDVISRHFVQTSSCKRGSASILVRSKRTRFCSFSSICVHFPLANAIPLGYLSSLESLHMHILRDFRPDCSRMSQRVTQQAVAVWLHHTLAVHSYVVFKSKKNTSECRYFLRKLHARSKERYPRIMVRNYDNRGSGRDFPTS
jgi:hypothetical protein